ncbi:QWRF motif-containing protein 2-like [Curcuma longa]|uniref:QWRF motif-containing protein 2-like n=1 Tax=Curcuma longa TaxID=136217 RepID=UPI003D9DC857
MDSDPQSALPPLHGSDAEANDRGLPHLPPPPADDRRPRRPRARQVSSRYRSPFPSPSSSYTSYETLNIAASPKNPSPKIRLIQKAHPSRVSPLPESSEEADENQPLTVAVRRSSETPLPGGASSSHAKPPGTLKKKAVVRLFADNNHHEAAEQPPLDRPTNPKRRLRPGTPIARPSCDPPATIPRAKNLPPTPAQVSRFPYEGSVLGGDKWRSDDTSSENSFSDTETCSISSQGGFCDSPPLPPASCRSRAITEVRSSMPEADLLPTMSARRQDSAEDASCRASTNSICLRSLSSALPSRQHQHPLNLNKSVSRPLFSLKPPQLPCVKPVTGLKKAPKSSARQEDIHMLRLLDNSYTQWRFVNAKAQAAEEAKRVSAERSLYGTSTRIAGLQNSVKEKKIQLETLKRRRNLLSIITHQMLHLDEWNSVQDDYSGSLSGITKALQDASLRLPITDDVKVDIRELEEVMNATLLTLESLSPFMGRFQPKAEDIDVVASNLASCTGNQRVLIEECGNLLSKANGMQVKELSLRAQLIQAKQSKAISR